jgi:1-acyl-sn-glycerol-3-phosphate acyltransferase
LKKIILILIHLIIGIICIFFFQIINRASRKSLIKSWSSYLLKIFNINLIVNHDLKKILSKKNYLIVSNHISWLDIFVINTAHPVTFVAKQSI